MTHNESKTVLTGDQNILLSSRLEAAIRGCSAPVVQAERRNLPSDARVVGRDGRTWPARSWTPARREAITAAVKVALAAGVHQSEIATAIGISKGLVSGIARSVPNRRRRGQR